MNLMYEVCSKKGEFSNFAWNVHSILDFCFVILLEHMSTTHFNIFSHSAFLVFFFQIQSLDVFRCAWRLAIEKKLLSIKCTPYNEASCDRYRFLLALVSRCVVMVIAAR